MRSPQQSLSQYQSQLEGWDQDAVRKALDELFTLAKKYTATKDYFELLKFVARFRFYSPFNAMLVHLQLPGARFVAPPHRWLRNYRRHIKPDARPLVILQPRGPVMLVFDVSDTEAEDGAPALPPEVDRPFEIRGVYNLGGEMSRTIENAKRDGVKIMPWEAGSQDAGEIRPVVGEKYVEFQVQKRPEPKYVSVPVGYEVLLNLHLSPGAQYATLVHELGHLYCGHLGTPVPKWWPDRRNLAHELREFEAESVCFLLCGRLGIENPSPEYLSDYVKNHEVMPNISIEYVMKSAGLIEQMGRGFLKPRK